MARFATLFLLAAAFAPASAFGATITVDTTADSFAVDGLCSLREAANSANFDEVTDTCAAGSGSDIINVLPGTIVLGATADLTSNVVVRGAGPSATTVDGNNLLRVFRIWPGSTVEIAEMKITKGHAPNASSPGVKGGNGGGILNEGSLTLTNVALSDNFAGNGAAGVNASFPGTTNGGPGGGGGDGGAVYSSGPLTLTNTEIAGNRAGNAGAGGSGAGGGPGGAGGNGGSGGGIYATVVLTVTGGSIHDNLAGSGGMGGLGTPNGFGGTGGPGGGIYTSGNATLTRAMVTSNATRPGVDGVAGGDPGLPGNGGGVFNNGGTFSATNSTFSENATGSASSIVSSSPQQGGAGGGVANYGGIMTLANSTVMLNTTGGGGAGSSNFGGTGGFGAGLANVMGTLTLVNTTVSLNATGDGGPGTTTLGAGGWGGGLAILFGTTTLDHVTLAANRVGNGSARQGGGIFVDSGSSVSLKNSIVSGNAPQNCELLGGATLADGGNNLSFPDATCPGVNADPRLGAVGSNGGPTSTMALLPGSAALDRVPPGAGCQATDQRGVPRPQGPACDSGAFELEVVPPSVDLTAPLASLITVRQKLGAALRKGYVGRLSTNEAGRGVLELFAKMPRRPVARLVRKRVAFGSRALAAPGQYRIVAKFTRKAKRRFAKAQRLVLSVRLTVTDAAGNKTVKTKRVTLRR